MLQRNKVVTITDLTRRREGLTIQLRDLELH